MLLGACVGYADGEDARGMLAAHWPAEFNVAFTCLRNRSRRHCCLLARGIFLVVVEHGPAFVAGHDFKEAWHADHQVESTIGTFGVGVLARVT